MRNVRVWWAQMPGQHVVADVKVLHHAVDSFERRVRRLLPIDLEQHQFDPILSFTYNLGAGALQASTLRKKILRYDMDGAAREFDRWVFAGGRKLAGLVRRRAAEREMFEG
jgi:lysozyme